MSFKIGDMLQIKSLEKLKKMKEYDHSYDPLYGHTGYFWFNGLEIEKDDCGKRATVTGINEDGWYDFQYLDTGERFTSDPMSVNYMYEYYIEEIVEVTKEMNYLYVNFCDPMFKCFKSDDARKIFLGELLIESEFYIMSDKHETKLFDTTDKYFVDAGEKHFTFPTLEEAKKKCEGLSCEYYIIYDIVKEEIVKECI